MILQVFEAGAVNGEYAVLRAGLDGHVCDRETVVHRKGGDAGAGEFERLVSRSVNADHPDKVQDEVLAAHMATERSVQRNPDGLGNAEPSHPGSHAARHVG